MSMGKHAKCKIFNDESRIWNMDVTGAAPRSYTMSYMEQEFHVLNILNISGASGSLASMGPTEKNIYLRNYSQYVHRSTDHLDVFYSKFNKTNVVLFHALDGMMVYFDRKIEKLFVPKFYHDNRTKTFLKTLKFVRVWDTIENKKLFEYPGKLGRKLYIYYILYILYIHQIQELSLF